MELVRLPQVGVEVLLDVLGQDPLVFVQVLKGADHGGGMPLDNRPDGRDGIGDNLRRPDKVDPAVVVWVDVIELIRDLVVDDIVVQSADAPAPEDMAEPVPLVDVVQDPPGDLVVLASPEGGERRR